MKCLGCGFLFDPKRVGAWTCPVCGHEHHDRD